MKALKKAAGIAALLIAMLAMAGTAHAEFTALNKSTKGKGELLEFVLKAGGATVQCSALAAGASEVSWTVKNSKEEAGKGAHLILKTAKWGKCTAEASKLKATEATLSGCEEELTQTGEEVAVVAKLLTACTIKAAACTITLATSENEKLTSVSTYPSGDKDVNTILEPEIKNAATKTSGECEALGIKASSEGSIAGVAEMKEVEVQRANEFTIGAAPLVYSGTVTTGSFTIRRVAAGASRYQTTFFVTVNNNFSRDIVKQATCDGLNFTSGQTCSVDLTYNLNGGMAAVSVVDFNGLSAEVRLRGT